MCKVSLLPDGAGTDNLCETYMNKCKVVDKKEDTIFVTSTGTTSPAKTTATFPISGTTANSYSIKTLSKNQYFLLKVNISQFRASTLFPIYVQMITLFFSR